MRRLARIVGMAALVACFAGTSLWADPPPSSGSIVIRTETNIAWTYVDFQRGVRVVYGTNIVEWCNNTNTWDVVRLLEIDVPEDSNRLIDLVQGDEVTTSVWPFTAFDCNLFTTVTPLATGTTDLIITDNDLLVYLVDNNRNWNAYGLVAHGFLEDPSGDVRVFSSHLRCVWDGNDSETERCTSTINLRN